MIPLPRVRLLATVALLLTTGAAPEGRSVPGDAPRGFTALEEFDAGRFWHAARLLRADGAAAGAPAERLLLARAEAGWMNWAAVSDLLDGQGWLGELDQGVGWLLLGRAHEEGGRWADAVYAYRTYLADRPAGKLGPVRARLARAAAHAGDIPTMLAALDSIPAEQVVVRSWAAVELAEMSAAEGDPDLVVELSRRIVDGRARDAAWSLVPRALLAAGDSAESARAYTRAAGALDGAEQWTASIEAARLELAQDDTAGVRAVLETGVAEAPPAAAASAAAGLLELGVDDLHSALRLARVLNRAGDGRRALRAYDVAHGLAAGGGAPLPERQRLARARLMATVRSRQAEALDEFRAIRATTTDAGIGAQNLEAWASLRRRQGHTSQVNTLRGWLLAEYPHSSQAAEVLWTRGSAAESRGDLEGALGHYASVVEAAPAHARSGQGRMRIGQIRLAQGGWEDAAGVFEGYLVDFPDGRRWEEASYWGARVRLELGDTVAARGLVARIRREDPISYYAVMGADLLGESYDVSVPAGASSAMPGWLAEGMRRLDLLVEAGLERGATAEEARLVERASASAEVTLSLAEELIERGRTIEGINLGWALRRDGHVWDRRLLEVVYPFPYRELVAREAAEWGVDPIMLAAVIRQESAFKADIVSHAGAVGLMQVMPATGKGLARAHGPDGFEEENLTSPEVNLHLGAAFFVDMTERYDGQLPLVLSAYNAGPTRATRWRRFPEASDPLRFTERIPFAETRGYVKNVRRNLGLYQVLYGPE